ncbi:hypothetical protein AU378_14020 [Chryseobacterium kwangjuense]|uniref:Uncharacterized protein n=1 Tax=Chryseobacterium kwangjuense TaxID=267125 RepID=A0A135WF49_9FLAO|nr:hypothetical protein AU378_14020 [Chryseobacterium kwangjuense]
MNKFCLTLLLLSIPRSITQNWKELHPEKFGGSEFASQVENDLEKIKLILDERIKKMTIAFYAFVVCI